MVIGPGFTTLTPYGLLHLVTAWIVASGSPAWGAALFGLFGLSNGLLLVVETAILALRDPNLPDLRTERRSQVFPRLSGGVLLATSLVLVIALFRGPGWGISSTAVPHTVSGSKVPHVASPEPGQGFNPELRETGAVRSAFAPKGRTARF